MTSRSRAPIEVRVLEELRTSIALLTAAHRHQDPVTVEHQNRVGACRQVILAGSIETSDSPVAP